MLLAAVYIGLDLGLFVVFYLSWATDLFWSRAHRQKVAQYPADYHFPWWFHRFYASDPPDSQ